MNTLKMHKSPMIKSCNLDHKKSKQMTNRWGEYQQPQQQPIPHQSNIAAKNFIFTLIIVTEYILKSFRKKPDGSCHIQLKGHFLGMISKKAQKMTTMTKKQNINELEPVKESSLKTV